MIRREAQRRLSRAQLYAAAVPIFTDALGVDDEKVTEDAGLYEVLGAESIDILDISFRLEQRFGLSRIPPETFLGNYSAIGEKYDANSTARREPTVGSILDHIHQKLNAGEQHG